MKEIVKMLAEVLMIMVIAIMGVYALIAGVIYITGYQAPGVITLEDWGHGVALCGEEGTGTQVDDDWVSVNRGGIYMLINDGHQGDLEVQQLWRKASQDCEVYELTHAVGR